MGQFISSTFPPAGINDYHLLHMAYGSNDYHLVVIVCNWSIVIVIAIETFLRAQNK